MASNNLENNIIQILQHLGEDPNREGLKGTPQRVVKSWKELYGGYGENPATIFTTFSDVEGYSQIVLLKDIEVFSMCEHHMLPFYGKAHVAYLPKGKVIGISKLARLVDIYARRLQIQERIGEQVTNALMKYLSPQGAACIIEASHMCMRMRGCNKQNSVMTTSSLKGIFLKDSIVRAELMQLIK
jgi:GTP cyclohydrolase I